ncbi:fluoride efflux transporter FluC [Jeotgalibacillus haloalkalitolerans]|uniref:Fluoride-specific ion channel FluC n=1 Tax=Jeotgalibacillus haloalkalitolerans TaxID=3104292 RepID=A0ABU5KI57_9BACL|nr:CrcB family protein [Jeotgalibacillus sp. HH7-29]MDZ5710834.1 CrcB family protein [Jeotgalibacillus sp. HH7-29]
MNLLLLGAGGFFGAIARYLLSTYGNRTSPFMPFGTMLVNLLGSFLLGMTIGFELSSAFNALFATGFLGAFTTFSTMQTEAVKLFDEKKRLRAALYLLMTFSGGTLFAALGFLIIAA